jgi:hypothetical protein
MRLHNVISNFSNACGWTFTFPSGAKDTLRSSQEGLGECLFGRSYPRSPEVIIHGAGFSTGGSKSLGCAPECSASATVGAEGEKGDKETGRRD